MFWKDFFVILGIYSGLLGLTALYRLSLYPKLRAKTALIRRQIFTQLMLIFVFPLIFSALSVWVHLPEPNQGLKLALILFNIMLLFITFIAVGQLFRYTARHRNELRG